jgi:pyruvate,water dikinase
VFFCTFEEIIDALTTRYGDLASIVRVRRAEFERDASRPDPPTTFVGTPPPVVLPPSGGPVLVGLGASGGVACGRARVLRRDATDADRLIAGEVLVAKTTDVGLSPLFLVACAVVTEQGGPLSHASIIAREYGVPTVVNVAGATAVIQTGDRIRVDGDRGTVERLLEGGPT